MTHEVAPPNVAGFLAAASTLHANTEGAPPLSATVFLVKDGKVVGHLATDGASSEAESERPLQKRSLWSRLFGTHQ